MAENSRRAWKRLILPLIIVSVIAGSSIGYLFATGQLSIPLPFGPGSQPSVLILLINYTISYDQNAPNPTVATIWLRNLGTTTGTVTALDIRDSNDSGPVLVSVHPDQTIAAHGGTAEVVVDTTSFGFYFRNGSSYWFTVTSNTGSQLGFRVSY